MVKRAMSVPLVKHLIVILPLISMN